MNTGLTNTDVWTLAINPNTPSTIYAGSWGGGVFDFQIQSPPLAPSSLTAKATSSKSIVLSWNDNSDNETGFKIYRKKGTCDSANSWAQIAKVGANVTTYTNTDIAPNTAYSYRVRAYNAGGNSAYSNCASAKTMQEEKIVAVDIKPGSCPNPFMLPIAITYLNGELPVAILGNENFDVRTVDPESIRLTREGVTGKVSPVRYSFEDVATPYEGEACGCHDLNGDGYIDMTLKFKRRTLATVLNLYEVAGQTVPLTITGNLKEEHDSTPIKGKDCVRIRKN